MTPSDDHNQSFPELALDGKRSPSASSGAAESLGRGLTSDELSLTDRVGVRLGTELRGVVESLNLRDRSVRGVAETLGIGRGISERMLAASRQGLSGREVIANSPGTEGLQMLVSSLRDRIADPALCDRVEAAIQEFMKLMRRLGPSHSKLLSRLREAAMEREEFDDTRDYYETLRRRAFRINRELCGTEIGFHGLVALSRPSPTEPGMIEAAGATALLRCQSRRGGLPLVVSASYTGPEHYAPDVFGGAVRRSESSKQWTPAGTLLEDFSTSPLPVVTARGPRKAVTNVIDTAPGSQWPVDVVIGRRFPAVPTSRGSGEPFFNTVARIRTPAQRLVFDLYVHASMTTPSGPVLAAYYWAPAITGNPSKDWAEQQPGTPRLQLLGRGLSHATHPAWPRHGELAQRAFRRLGWDQDEFVGFRADVSYPLWGASYFLTFDYSEDPQPSESNNQAPAKAGG